MNTTLNSVDFTALSPLLILLFGALVVLLVETFAENASKKWSFYITIVTILCALFGIFTAPISSSPLLTPWLRFDSFSVFFTTFFLLIGLGSTLLSYSFLQRTATTHGEYYFLLLSSLFGLILISSSANFLTLFLGLETLSISLYILCGYIKKWETSNESSMKYFLMGALATAFLLYGVALIYGAIGSTSFDGMLASYKAINSDSGKALFLGGVMLVTLGLAFKAAIVPFHVWAPDVYEGAPTPVTAFMAVGTKAGAFAAFALIFLIALPQFNLLWNETIALLAYPTLIYANAVAMRQTQLRRFFAYSGISHAGFLLIPLAAGTPDALQALMFYLVVYALATLGSFSVLAFIDRGSSGISIEDLRGLFHRSPFLAGVLALCFLTLAGIPPTAGFFAKFYIFKVAFEAGYIALLIVGLLTTILSAYYYLRFVAVMFADAPKELTPPQRSWTATTVGIISFAAIVFLSCYPSPLLELLAIGSR